MIALAALVYVLRSAGYAGAFVMVMLAATAFVLWPLVVAAVIIWAVGFSRRWWPLTASVGRKLFR